MESNLNLLNEILLSNDVRVKFFNEYNNNKIFKDWLLSILPEIDLCVKQKQNNPWHIYDVMNHLLVSVEKMNAMSGKYSQEDRRMLAYTMFLHDIGKPACHLTRKKNGVMIDSFFNHNLEGEKVVLRVADKFGFDKNQTFQISKLVKDHDIFMFLTIDKTENPHKKQLTSFYVSNKIEELNSYGNGKKLNEMLGMVGRCDSLAQNPEMTSESMLLLDKYQNISQGLSKTENIDLCN